MHELGLVMKVIDEAEQVARANDVKRVLKLTLEVGEVSSVVPSYFTDCFEWAKRKTEFLKDAELNMIILKGISYCNACKQTYPTVDYAKKCPHCGSDDTYLVTGNELNIKDLEVE